MSQDFEVRRTRALMRRAALGVALAVLVGTAVTAGAVLAVRLLQQGAPPVAGPAPAAPSQETLRSSAGVVLLTGLLAGMGAAVLTAWIALAPIEAWFRRGGLSIASAFGAFLGMLLLVPVEMAFGRTGLGVLLALLLGAAGWLALRLRRRPLPDVP